MLVVALTGGIGSGKSTVARLFAELGTPIIDSDIIAYDLVQPGMPALAKIKEYFGPEIVHLNGTLNRTKLREIVFINATARKWLENLLHPLILIEIEKEIQKLEASYCIVVIPLLIETQVMNSFDRILIVDAPEELQIQRTVTRDNCTDTQVKKVMLTQASREQRLTFANDIIMNDNGIDDLRYRVESLHREYLKLAQECRNCGQF